MTNFFEDNAQQLEAFSHMSQTIGARADYVQGGGGNTSCKLKDGRMAIKASGFCLADIRPNAAYAVMAYTDLRDFYMSHDPAALLDVEKEGAQMAKACTLEIEGLPALRPSVEAGFHSVLDTFVIHSHSVYANLAACAKECSAIMQAAMQDAPYTFAVVPYTDPGARLTFSIRDAIAQTKKAGGAAPSAILMQNHGLIVTHADAQACVQLHADVNRRIASVFSLREDAFPPIHIDAREDGLYQSASPFLIARLACGDYGEACFLEHALYPDQLVFLRGTFSFGAGMPEADTCRLDPSSGIVTYNMAQSKAQVIEETLAAIVFIEDHIAKGGYEVATMGEAAKAFINNWESEKYRKSLASK